MHRRFLALPALLVVAVLVAGACGGSTPALNRSRVAVAADEKHARSFAGEGSAIDQMFMDLGGPMRIARPAAPTTAPEYGNRTARRPRLWRRGGRTARGPSGLGKRSRRRSENPARICRPLGGAARAAWMRSFVRLAPCWPP